MSEMKKSYNNKRDKNMADNKYIQESSGIFFRKVPGGSPLLHEKILLLLSKTREGDSEALKNIRNVIYVLLEAVDNEKYIQLFISKEFQQLKDNIARDNDNQLLLDYLPSEVNVKLSKLIKGQQKIIKHMPIALETLKKVSEIEKLQMYILILVGFEQELSTTVRKRADKLVYQLASIREELIEILKVKKKTFVSGSLNKFHEKIVKLGDSISQSSHPENERMAEEFNRYTSLLAFILYEPADLEKEMITRLEVAFWFLKIFALSFEKSLPLITTSEVFTSCAATQKELCKLILTILDKLKDYGIKSFTSVPVFSHHCGDVVGQSADVTNDNGEKDSECLEFRQVYSEASRMLIRIVTIETDPSFLITSKLFMRSELLLTELDINNSDNFFTRLEKLVKEASSTDNILLIPYLYRLQATTLEHIFQSKHNILDIDDLNLSEHISKISTIIKFVADEDFFSATIKSWLKKNLDSVYAMMDIYSPFIYFAQACQRVQLYLILSIEKVIEVPGPTVDQLIKVAQKLNDIKIVLINQIKLLNFVKILLIQTNSPNGILLIRNLNQVFIPPDKNIKKLKPNFVRNLTLNTTNFFIPIGIQILLLKLVQFYMYH